MMRRSALSDDSDEVKIDLSPMIDCIFILLIFFIVTTVFVNEAGVTVNKPEVKGAQALDKNSILIAVTADNDVAYDGKIIGVQGVATVVKAALKDNKEMPVIIQGDADASHGIVQMVHGEAIVAGATKISVSSKNN
ncbi:MAG: biopolymer transport protein ExbD [Verrucomicrobiales bacterium]|jgi:biopolymer transport protein ExbD